MLEIPRLILLLVMLGIASYHDVRTRSVPDYVWIFGGGAGALLYLFDWSDVDGFVLLSISTGAIASATIWRLFPMGDADALAILAISVVYPVSFGTVMVPIVAFFGGLVLEHMAAFVLNVRYNLEDIYHGCFLSGVQCSRITKIVAFYSVHRRRKHEKFTFCAEMVCNGTRRLSLRTPNPESDYESRSGIAVTWAMPAIPFVLGAVILGVFISAIP